MKFNQQALSKKAIDAALKQDWKAATQLNEQILEKNPNDIDAKTRLGRAYLKTKKYSKAKKIYKQILDNDPINKIAQKNYKLASAQKSDDKTDANLLNNSNEFIKEPGTTYQVELEAPKTTLKKLKTGQEVVLRHYKTKLSFYVKKGRKELGVVTNELKDIVYDARQEKKDVSAKVVKIKDESFIVLLKCKSPIFKSEKQSEKPFMKKSMLDEPAVDVSETEEQD